MRRRRFLKWLGLAPAVPAVALLPEVATAQDKPDDPITQAMAVIEEIKKFPQMQYQGFLYPTHCKCGAQAQGQLGFARFHLTGPTVGGVGSSRWRASFFSTPVGYGDSPIEAIRNAARETLDLLRKGREYTCKECRGEPVTGFYANGICYPTLQACVNASKTSVTCTSPWF